MVGIRDPHHYGYWALQVREAPSGCYVSTIVVIYHESVPETTVSADAFPGRSRPSEAKGHIPLGCWVLPEAWGAFQARDGRVQDLGGRCHARWDDDLGGALCSWTKY